MNTDDGTIYSPEDYKKIHEAEEEASKDLLKKLIPMDVPPTERQLHRGKVGRNEPCPCGSGKKFKNCHWTGR